MPIAAKARRSVRLDAANTVTAASGAPASATFGASAGPHDAISVAANPAAASRNIFSIVVP